MYVWAPCARMVMGGARIHGRDTVYSLGPSNFHRKSSCTRVGPLEGELLLCIHDAAHSTWHDQYAIEQKCRLHHESCMTSGMGVKVVCGGMCHMLRCLADMVSARQQQCDLHKQK